MPLTIDEFRVAASAFIEEALASGVAYAAFGSIMPPAKYELARAWQQHTFAHGFAGVSWPIE